MLLRPLTRVEQHDVKKLETIGRSTERANSASATASMEFGHSPTEAADLD